MNKIKEEALLRIKYLEKYYGVTENIYDTYLNEDKVLASTPFNLDIKEVVSILPLEYIAVNGVALNVFIENFERKHRNCKVYHVIISNPYINLLYVGGYEDDWLYERPDEYNVQAYVINVAIPVYSEFGRIAIEGKDNGLIRTM